MTCILINALHSKSGGGLTYLQNMLPLMAREKDIDLHVCIHHSQEDILPEGLKDVTVHRLDFRTGFWRLPVREQIEVPRLARKIGADVTFSPANYGPVLAPNSVILLRNALSVAFVEVRAVKLAYWALVYLGTALSLAACRRAIAVSDYTKKASSGGLLGIFNRRLTVIPHGVSGKFSPPGKERGRETFLLAVSDLYVQKNLKNLIYALALLKKKNPAILLKIAGRPLDTVYFAELKRVIGEEKLEGNIEFMGGVSQDVLADLYRRCGLFVFPSSVETFGNPLVEAMASGAPIACSESAAMPEVAGDAAVYFDPRNPDDMAKALARIMSEQDLRETLSKKAVDRAREFTWEKTVKKTLEVLKSAAVPPSSGNSN